MRYNNQAYYNLYQGASSKIIRMYEELCKIVASEHNYKNLRALVTERNTPLIPFPGVYQGDLVIMIEHIINSRSSLMLV